MAISAVKSKPQRKKQTLNKETKDANENNLEEKISKPSFKPKAIIDYYNESDEINQFKKIVCNYDITNISITEANEMYKALYKNELIKLKDTFVTLDSEKITNWQDLTPIISTLKANNSYASEKINLLENIKNQAEANKENGTHETQEFYERAIQIAEKILYFQQSMPKSISA